MTDGNTNRTESEIRDLIFNYMKRSGEFGYVWRDKQDYRKGGAFFKESKGVSDILAVRKGDGKMVAIEVKKPGGVISAEQKSFLEAVHSSGGIALVAFGLDDVRNHGL